MTAYRSDYLVAPASSTKTWDGPPTVRDEFWVYYHLAADGAVLYIGKTKTPLYRTRAHATNSSWFDDVEQFVWFGPMDEINAAAVERELIRTEQPPNNIKFTDRDLGARPASPADRLRRYRERVAHLQNELAWTEQRVRLLEVEAIS